MSNLTKFGFCVTFLYNLIAVKCTLWEEFSKMQQTNNDLAKCLENLTNMYFQSNENVLYSHWNRDVNFAILKFQRNYTTQVYNSKKITDPMVLPRFKRFTAYVLVVDSDQFANLLAELNSMIRWNARAKFIIILQGRINSKVWTELVRYYVINVIVIDSSSQQLYTYFPYEYENLRNPQLETYALGPCVNFDTERGSLYFLRTPKLWRNTTVIIPYMPLHPYVIDADQRTGIELELMKIMEWYMQYEIKYSDIPYVDWGYLLPNNSYTGPIGAVQRYEGDFVLGHYHLREEERVTDFDATFSYMDDDICWIVPIALMRSHWQNIMNIFDRSIWLMTSATMFVSYVAWQFFNWRSPFVGAEARRYYANPFCSMEVPFVSFLGLPIMHEPKSLALRLLFLAIFFFCFILVTGWKSYLIVSLTHDTPEHQISTLHDIVESALEIGIYSELIDLQCAEGTPDADYICRTADPNRCDASHACLDQTAYQRNMVTIATKRILRYMSPQKYRTTTGREMIYIFKECIAKDYTVQYYTRGHPLFPQSNELLMWIRTSGFVNNLDDRSDHELALSFQEYVQSLSVLDISVLGLMQVQGMFYLLMGGLLGSVVVFLGELYFYRNRRAIRNFVNYVQRKVAHAIFRKIQVFD